MVSNGSMTLHGLDHEPRGLFTVDPSNRPVRRVVTGGAADRLHFSDGSMAVKLPPRVVSAEPHLASRALPLRDGTTSSIAQRAARRPATSVGMVHASMEVSSLSSFHMQGRVPGERKKTAGDHSYATLRSPHEWDRSVRSRQQVFTHTRLPYMTIPALLSFALLRTSLRKGVPRVRAFIL